MAGARSKRRPQRTYTAEFKAEIVDLVNAGDSAGSVAKAFDLTETSVRSWVAKAAAVPVEAPEPEHGPPPAGLFATAQAGIRLQTLRVLRDRLAIDIDICQSARDVAALSQRLLDVLAQIEAAEKAAPAAKGTPLDELARRRALGPTAAAKPRPKVVPKRG